MTRIENQSAEQLLSQRAWLRRLAQKLVLDEARADDLCQEALVQALGRPLSPAAQRAWLARAARSLGARQARDDQRRRRREVAAARPLEQPAAADVVAQLAAHRRVVEAVMRLAEPYRTAVVLRHWEDLPPRAIALRLRVPVETVRSRLKRGHEMLRRRLDREFGGRGAWVAPIVALHGIAPRDLAVPNGFAAAKSKLAAVAVVAVATLGLSWSLGPWNGETAPVAERAGAAPARPVDEARGSGSPPRRELAAFSPVTDPVAGTERLLRGRVLDVTARPLADVRVRLQTETRAVIAQTAAGATDAHGVFVLERPPFAAEVVIDDPGFATVLVGRIAPGSSAEPVVVAAAALRVGGAVVDDRGRPVADAQVTCVLPRDFRARFAAVLDNSRAPVWTVHSAADGRFDMPMLGHVEGAVLTCSAAGHLPVSRPLPPCSSASLRVVLRRPEPIPGRLLGQVIEPNGTPAAGALVRLGGATTVAGSDGRFAFDGAAAARECEVLAVQRGFLPGTVTITDPAARPFVTVRLGAPPLAITGRLLDADGEPIAGAKVWAGDPTVFGELQDGLGLISVEGYLGGGLTKAELSRRFTRLGWPLLPVDEILGDNPTAKWNWVRTDRDGRFRLGGLLNRAYSLVALRPGTLVRATAGPIYAGASNALIQEARDARAPVIAGRVISRDGEPVRAVRVELACDAIELQTELRGSGGARWIRSSGRSESGHETVTDDDGRFRFENAGVDEVYLRLDGDSILPTSHRLEASIRPLRDLAIGVAIRRHLRVELAQRGLADQVGALGAGGEPTNLWMFRGQGVDSLDRVALHDGRSQVLCASESVTTLILYRDGAEVRRVPVELEPGVVNVIRD